MLVEIEFVFFSGHVSDAMMQCQLPTCAATLEDDVTLKLGKARLTGRSATQLVAMDEDEVTQADINSVCEIVPAPWKSE